MLYTIYYYISSATNVRFKEKRSGSHSHVPTSCDVTYGPIALSALMTGKIGRR